MCVYTDIDLDVYLPLVKGDSAVAAVCNIYIRLSHYELINGDEGKTIPECWQPVLSH